MQNTITIDKEGSVKVEKLTVVFEGDITALDKEILDLSEEIFEYNNRILELTTARDLIVPVLAEKQSLRTEITLKAKVEGKSIELTEEAVSTL